MLSRYKLARRAVQLFPQTEYADPATVSHARRKWMASVIYLREREVSRYHMDHPVQRVSHSPVKVEVLVRDIQMWQFELAGGSIA